ncbi:MAG: archease [bacterium]
MSEAATKYLPIDHTADAGLKVFGCDLADLFCNAALGMFAMISNLETVHSTCEMRLRVEATDLAALLLNWLSELNYRFLTERMVFKNFQIDEIGPTALLARVQGEELDLDRHELYTEIKAVTYHKLYVRETVQGWEAQVIFDL